MKLYFLIVFLLVTTLVSCYKEEVNLYSGSWKLVQIETLRGENLKERITIEKPVNLKGDVVLNFKENNFEQYTGNTPTNTFLGAFSITSENELKVISFALITKVAETPWGQEFTSRIDKVNRYQLSGNSLILMTNTDKLIFKK